MDYRTLGRGLGWFSLALGATELFAAKRVARRLGVEGNEALIRAFGVREIVAGAGLLNAPAHATNVWGRVAGDAMDLAALGLAARKSTRQGALWAAIAFVAGATALDVAVARGLDRTTGKTLPSGA